NGERGRGADRRVAARRTRGRAGRPWFGMVERTTRGSTVELAHGRARPRIPDRRSRRPCARRVAMRRPALVAWAPDAAAHAGAPGRGRAVVSRRDHPQQPSVSPRLTHAGRAGLRSVHVFFSALHLHQTFTREWLACPL